MVLPVVAAAGRGIAQGAGNIAKGAGNTVKDSMKGSSGGGKSLDAGRGGGERAKQGGDPNTRQGSSIAKNLGQPLQQTPQQKSGQGAEGAGGGQNQAGVPGQAMSNIARQNASGIGKGGGGAKDGSSPLSGSGTGSVESFGDQAKSKSISSLFFSLLAAIGILDIFNGTWIVFLLWGNYIGWHLLPVARPVLSKPGNEIIFLSPDWRELIHTVVLFVLTAIYLLEVMLYVAVAILIFALIAEIMAVLPPPLNTLFQ